MDAFAAAVMVPPARPADEVRPTPQKVCRWPTMAIRELTMAAADSDLAADPLFHLGPGATWAGSRCTIGTCPELKYLTCQACAEGDGRSVVELEEVACQHRIPTG